MQTKLILVAAGALASLACSSGDPVNIGENEPAKTGEFLSDYAASWDGYAEGYAFESGSDRVRLVLDENGEGYLELGDRPPFAPATDPDVPYPVEIESPLHGHHGLIEGFRYTARFATVVGTRMRVGFSPLELYSDWCELQTSYPSDVGSTGYDCLPNWSGVGMDGACFLKNPDDGTLMEVDCQKMSLCGLGFICSCTADGCGVAEPESLEQTPSLDGALEDGGNSLDGSLALLGNVRVRLTRQ